MELVGVITPTAKTGPTETELALGVAAKAVQFDVRLTAPAGSPDCVPTKVDATFGAPVPMERPFASLPAGVIAPNWD